MAAYFLATWHALKSVVFTDAFAKSPAAGIVVGVVLLVIKDRYDRHQARRTLLRALNTEARSTWLTIHDLLGRFPTKAEADAVVNGATAGTLDFETLDALPAGWVLFAPSFPLSEAMTKLKPKEAIAAIEYFDAWSRVTEYGRQAGSFYMKLVDLTPHVKKAEQTTQVREVAHQVRGTFRQFLGAAKNLSMARQQLEHVTAEGLSWNPLTIFRPQKPLEALNFPGDWETPAEPPTPEVP